ncbi:LysR family transcriptional regulator [Pandoraea fibrosis]|uniref:LysR family transcriptional regulator n=1 Tax=Pandoraea fibrosis TaxID=1891094 RepID=A0A5E4TPR2_9BURK|nr:LysR family transcriptional regulator [Pandoraea fibrosis]QHE90921.1 LysR family transcriptional regulator [Pandoraea fibrosis]QHF11752.1 LysR family transcriptional regulator [Pandoraea fibrosis]VVD89807.1 LysR family transcriptional regulator [Pandoraea fibrosis]
MQLRWLEDFVELARTRSFTRAAENRFVTHPAFGRRIRALEEWVGTQLVERSKPLELTAAGTVFLDAATNALDILHSARTQLQDAAPTLENNLKIATGRTLAATFFPDWYDETVSRIGFFSATLSTSGAEEAILRLAAGEVDLLIVYSSAHTRLLIDQERYDWLSVAREVLVPVSALDARGRAKYRLAAGPSPIPWLAFTRTLTLRAVLARHLAEMPNRPTLKPVYQADSYEAILAMARRGTGIAWLPQRLVADDVARGTLAIVGGKDWQIGFDIALYRRRHQPHPVLDAIWQRVRQGSGDDA